MRCTVYGTKRIDRPDVGPQTVNRKPYTVFSYRKPHTSSSYHMIKIN